MGRTAALAIGLAALLPSVVGCGTSDTFAASGRVFLDGQPAVAELLFERLSESGKPHGQPVTVTSRADGRFDVAIPLEAERPSALPCRISVRVPRSSQQISSAFDYDALPDKVVDLRRDLAARKSLTLLLTQ